MALETVYAMQANELMICADVPLDASQVRQLSFADKTEQYNYFRSKAIRVFTDFKYIREHRGVKVPVNAEEIGNACYLCFKNQASGKWYYAFVTQVIYINPETSLLNFEIDVYQTFLFDMVIRDCDISREHVANDDFKTNTVQEPVDVGDYVIAHEEVQVLGDLDSNYPFIILSAIDLLSDPGTLEEPKVTAAQGGVYGGLPSAVRAYLVEPNQWETSSITAIMEALSSYPWVSQSILAIYAVPSFGFSGTVTVRQSAMGFNIGVISDSSSPFRSGAGGALIGWQSKFPSYKNKKMYNSQFSFIECLLPNGNRFVLKPEFIKDSAPVVMLVSTLIPAPNFYFYTPDYCGAEEDFLLNANNISGFPCFPVQNNTYPLQTAQAEATNTLVHSQNRSNIFWDTVGNVVQSVFTGDPLNVLSTGIDAYKNVRSEIQNSERDRQRIGQMQTNVSLTGASGGGLATFIASKSWKSYIDGGQ